MRIAEALNNTKKRMMDAFDRGDRAMVAELTDLLAYTVMDNMALYNLHMNILVKEKDKKTIMEIMKEISLELDAEKARVMEGYEFEEEA